MKIAVMGAGGVGGYFGGLLARAGHDVTFVARGPHLAAVQARGLTVESANHGTFTVMVKALEDTSQAGEHELVVFAVKMYDNAEAIEAIRPMVGPETVILTLQNGIENGSQLAQAYGESRVMVGSVYLEGRIREPGVVTQGGPGAGDFGELQPGITPRSQKLLAIFEDAGCRIQLQENIGGMLWKKFAYLSASASICAASGATIGEVRSAPETRGIIQQAIEEALSVGRAGGAPIMDDSLEWAMKALDNFPASGRPSLAKDFAEGRPVELEGLTGAVVRMGKETGVPTPINDTLYAVLRPYTLRISGALDGAKVPDDR